MLLSASVSETHICLLYCAKMQEPHTSLRFAYGILSAPEETQVCLNNDGFVLQAAAPPGCVCAAFSELGRGTTRNVVSKN